MFKELPVPSWVDIISIATFLIVLAIFVSILVKAVRMPKKEIKRLSELPLSDQPTASEESENERTKQG